MMCDATGRPIGDPEQKVVCELEGGPHDGEYWRFSLRELMRADEVNMSDGNVYQLILRGDGPWLLRHAPMQEAMAARRRRR